MDEKVGDSLRIDRSGEEKPLYQIAGEVEKILAREESSLMFKQAVESSSDYNLCIYDLVDRDCLF